VQITAKQRESDLRRSLEAFDPERFGLIQHGHGWIKEFAGIGPVAFASLAWPHAQSASFQKVGDRVEPANALSLLVQLQQDVWGFPAEESVPVNVLSILEDTGGSVVVAYRLETGFNADGWLGFAIGMGTRSGPMYSHMLGVREEIRGSLDLGWYLKVLQGYLAIESGHDAMTWTVDPMRGANARLNLEKLRATMINFTIDKYGILRSSLYGDVPTDRFTAHWDLHSPAVHERISSVASHEYSPLQLEDIVHLPEATVQNLDVLTRLLPDRISYQIPGDVDALMKDDPERAIKWRQDMREILGKLMTRRAATLGGNASEGPIAVGMDIQPGAYEVTGFATGIDAVGERLSYYLLERKGTP
jgi:predicted GNAT superfamily acetyltransferase